MSLTRKQLCAEILAALDYRSGADSCNTVYAGSLQTCMVISALGGSYDHDGAEDLLPKASMKMVRKAHQILDNIIEYMKAHPTKKCPTCGQIMPARRKRAR